MENKEVRRQKRKMRVRGKVTGLSLRPRLSVFRSNQHIYAQLIDDQLGKTLAAASDLTIKKGSKSEKATEVGKEVAKIAKSKKLESVVFDRNGYKYHGRIKAIADGAREGGLIF